MSMVQGIVTDFIEKRLARPAQQRAAAQPAQRDILKGLVAGAIGGIVATAAKSLAEKIYPPRTHGEPEPPGVLVDKLGGSGLAPATKSAATEVIHWGFGAAAGAAYGALAEFYPTATAHEGASFGMTLMALTHEGALPVLGLAANPDDQTIRERSSEVVTHVLFGLVTEVIRSSVRSHL